MRSTWIDAGGRPLAVHVFEPAGMQTDGGMLVVPAFGFEAEVSYRTVQSLAEHAARAGLVAVVPDLTGYGDSASSDGVDDLADAWREDLTAAAALLREEIGDAPLTAVGYRLGGALVATLPDGVVDARVAWDPVSGSAFVRRQKMFGKVARMGRGDATGDVELLGLELTDAQIVGLKTVPAPAKDDPRVTIRREPPAPGKELGFDTYRAEVPLAGVRALVDGCARGTRRPVRRHDGLDTSPAALDPQAPGVAETFTRIGPHRLHAVVTRPASDTPDADVCVVFTAQGAERASGPGNLWTLLARELAAEGVTSIRADRRGVGWHTDPDAPRQADPFSDDTVDDVADVAREARARGFRRVVLVGSCAGAWLAVAAARRAPVDDVLALGMPAWAAAPDTLDRNFLDFWHGVAPVGDDPAEARTLDRRARIDARLAGLPRLQEPLGRLRLGWGLTRRSARFRSTGLPVLWALPTSTTCRVVLAGNDVQFFTASGGRPVVAALRALGRRVSVVEVEDMDHALRSTFARGYVRTCLRGLLGLRAARRPRHAGSAARVDCRA